MTQERFDMPNPSPGGGGGTGVSDIAIFAATIANDNVIDDYNNHSNNDVITCNRRKTFNVVRA